MKLLTFPFLDALAACVSSHPEMDSIECQMASFSLKHDRSFGTFEFSIASQIASEIARNRDRATSISSILSAGGLDPHPSPPREGEDDISERSEHANLSPAALSTAAAAHVLPERTLVTLIAMLNESFPDFKFECVQWRVLRDAMR